MKLLKKDRPGRKKLPTLQIVLWVFIGLEHVERTETDSVVPLLHRILLVIPEF